MTELCGNGAGTSGENSYSYFFLWRTSRSHIRKITETWVLKGNIKSKSRSGLHFVAFGHRCYMNPPAQGIILDTHIKKKRKSSFHHLKEEGTKPHKALLPEEGKEETQDKNREPWKMCCLCSHLRNRGVERQEWPLLSTPSSPACTDSTSSIALT